VPRPADARPGARPSLRAVLTVALVAAATLAVSGVYPRAMLPIYRVVTAAADPALDLRSLEIEQPRTESVFAARLVNGRYVDVGGRLLAPGEIDIRSTTLTAHALQHLVFLFGTALAGAAYLPVARGRFAAALIAAWLLVEIVDVPLVLIGSAWDLVLARGAPERLGSSAVVAWMRFMTDGGRIGLALAAGLLALVAGRARPAPPRRRKRTG